jgi:molybdate transport system substrate-binding protein
MRWVALVLICVACGPAANAPAIDGGVKAIDVFAAASLTEAFKALPTHDRFVWSYNFAGSPTLATQLENGAQADVFASADTANMDRLDKDGLLAEPSRVFAHNKLEIVVAAGNPKGIHGLADLARPGIVYMSAGPTVPAGKYATQILAMAGVTVTAKSLETDVKSVVGKIELGEADAGIVYVTDVMAAGAKVQGVPIPDSANVVATYPVAVLKSARNRALAEGFVDGLLSAQGQAVLQRYGFLPA